MERNELDEHEPAKLASHSFINKPELFTPEKNTIENNLEIEVLDIDHFGILAGTFEENDENLTVDDDHLNNDFNIKISCSPAKSVESTSSTCKINGSSDSFVKSASKLQIRNYKCRHCGFFTQNSRQYLYHLQDVHDEIFVIHECKNCDYASKHIKNLQRHCNVIHGEDSEFSKQLSKKIHSRFPRKLHPHLPKKAKSENTRKFQCNLCSFHTTSQRLLSVHVSAHNLPLEEQHTEISDGKEPTNCNGVKVENQCKTYFSNEKFPFTGLLNSRAPKTQKCPLCKMNIQYVSWLIRHLRNNHRGNIRAEKLATAYEMRKRKKRPNNTGYQMCNNSSKLKKLTNMRVPSSGSKSIQMKLDDFVSLSDISAQPLLSNHKVSHRKSDTNVDNDITCNLCYLKLNGMLEYQEHMQSHSTSSNCNFSLNSVKSTKYDTFDSESIVCKAGKQSDILINVRNKLGSKFSDLEYKCPYCSFTIRSVSRFHLHFIQHIKNLQFRCSDCDYHSSWKWSVVKHIWSKIRNEKNHHDAFVLTNNELVDLNNFKLYKKYLVKQPKSVNNQLNMPQVNAVQGNHSAWFQSAKPSILPNDVTSIVDSPMEITNSPNLLSLSVPDSSKETNYYYCKECSFKNISKQIVINHLASHAGIKPFQCSVCNFRSNWKHVIIRHMKNLHTGHNNIIEQKINFIQDGFILCRESLLQNSRENNEYPKIASHRIMNCHICPYRTHKKYHMNFHKQQHKYKASARYKCDECPYYVTFERALVRHKKLHSDFTLAHDNESLKVDNYVKEFVSSVPPEIPPRKYFHKKPLECAKCPARFSQQDRFRRHLELHGQDYRFKCNQCDYSVQCGANLVKHKKLHDVNVNPELELPDSSQPFSCSVCAAVFTLKTRYIRHLKLHNRNYNTQNISSLQGNVNAIQFKKHKLFKRKSELNLTKSIKCPKCPTLICSKERYIRHLELHGKDYRFTCRYCDFSVQNAVNMQRHEKIHIRMNLESQDFVPSENLNNTVKADEFVAVEPVVIPNEKKLFICDRCPYYSGSKSAVQNHQRSHWFKQSFECPHCDYSAMQRGSLQAHLKLHLEGSKLFPPEAFMKFQSFKIIVQGENGERLMFDDETMVSEEREKSENDEHVIDNEVENNLKMYSESKEISDHINNAEKSLPNSHLKSKKEPIVVLTDIFDIKHFVSAGSN